MLLMRRKHNDQGVAGRAEAKFSEAIHQHINASGTQANTRDLRE